MRVIIDGRRYMAVKEIIDILERELKDEKKDCFNDDERSGFELAEKRIRKRLFALGRDVALDKRERRHE